MTFDGIVFCCPGCGLIEHGLVSVICPRCDNEDFADRVDLAALVCLAANLAAAAGLCHAFDLGQNPRSLGPMRMVHVLPSGTKVWEPAGDWSPGCGRDVPGCGRSAT